MCSGPQPFAEASTASSRPTALFHLSASFHERCVFLLFPGRLICDKGNMAAHYFLDAVVGMLMP